MRLELEAVDPEPEVKALFEKHEIALGRMERIPPSLEDVFVALIEREGER